VLRLEVAEGTNVVRALSLAVAALALIPAAGCRTKKMHIERHVSYTTDSTPAGIAADSVRLPAAVRYPGAELVSASESETDGRTGGTWLLSTPDSLPLVAAFYQQALAGSAGSGRALSPNHVVLTAESEDGQEGTSCVLLGQDHGTQVVIVRWNRPRP